ncbi:hypothetical protein EDEG_00800 [Edhazardia aedis USNM 41457]|uniref:Uncharacterized protein n=1 Tax=Edhazardia aedis (strain USNM 41457) TaxID=1003232 RepID=J9DUZ4_EDHAE|nr:hypothetical protein EDEG_00800 [Edhazardia aedis USNM 41457]|eukprot:EJW05087.1 hypothetical protein EDEG_00800 [Edhazardia aedis USNM 41457]
MRKQYLIWAIICVLSFIFATLVYVLMNGFKVKSGPTADKKMTNTITEVPFIKMKANKSNKIPNNWEGNDSYDVRSIEFLGDNDVYEYAKKRFKKVSDDAHNIAGMFKSLKDTCDVVRELFPKNGSVNTTER